MHDEKIQTTNESEPDLKQLINVLLAAKKLVIGVTFVFAVIGIAYALLQPNIYRSKALLAPAEENTGGGLSAMASQFGGLASLAGVSLGKGSADKPTMALEILKSRMFIAEFIKKRNLSVPLLAGKSWDGKELILDTSLYDPVNLKWSPSLLNGESDSPTDWDLYEKFNTIMKVNQDKVTGLVTISIDHLSPILAKQWTDWLISDLNQHIRQVDINEAQTSVSFLEKQLQQTSITNMQTVFYQLIEKQYQTIMLANVREQYMFKVLDPAVVAQEKSEPKRALLVMFSMMLGLMFSVVFVLFRYYYK
jgi:uncharacterized protein involved in exopolysaccharide biosynthesis